MRKILIAILIILAFANCSSKNKRTEEKNTSIPEETLNIEHKMNNKNDITITINQNSVSLGSDSVIVATIINNSDQKISMGLDYDIDYFESNEWKEFITSKDFFVRGLEIFIKPGSSEKIDIFLYPQNFSYKPGKYRIKKKIMINNEVIELITDFEVNK